MKTSIRTSILLVTLLVGCLTTVACSKLAVLQAVVDSTAAAVPILEAAGVPIPPQVPAYVAAVADCIGMQTGTPTTNQLLLVSACLGKEIAPTLPPGIPQAVAGVVQLVIQDVLNYLQQNPPPVVGVVAAHAPISLSAGDVVKLQAMQAKAKATAEALRKYAALRK